MVANNYIGIDKDTTNINTIKQLVLDTRKNVIAKSTIIDKEVLIDNLDTLSEYLFCEDYALYVSDKSNDNAKNYPIFMTDEFFKELDREITYCRECWKDNNKYDEYTKDLSCYILNDPNTYKEYKTLLHFVEDFFTYFDSKCKIDSEYLLREFTSHFDWTAPITDLTGQSMYLYYRGKCYIIAVIRDITDLEDKETQPQYSIIPLNNSKNNYRIHFDKVNYDIF